MHPQTLLQIVNPTSQPPFEWASNHLHLIAWPTICFTFWKAARAFERVLLAATKAASQVDQLTTNHFPHMEASLANQDKLMASMDTKLGTLIDVMRK